MSGPTTATDPRALAERVTRWAASTLAPGTARRYEQRSVDAEAWAALAERGLLGLLVGGGRAVDLLASAEGLVAGSHDLGLGLSWLVQELVGAFQLELGANTDAQRALLTEVASGAKRLAFAVSEQPHGAHPRHLATRAIAADAAREWTIDGEKVYCTNGPIADALIVVAKTRDGGEHGHHELSAFVVPADTPGLAVTPMALPFCQSSPHGTVRLDGVRVGAEAMLGRRGEAYKTLVKPFRGIEDAFALGLFVGQLGWLLDAIAPAAMNDTTHHERVGAAAARLAGARACAYRAAELRDDRDVDGELALRNAAQLALDDCAGDVRALAAAIDSGDDVEVARGLADLALAKVASGVRRALRRRLATTRYGAPG